MFVQDIKKQYLEQEEVFEGDIRLVCKAKETINVPVKPSSPTTSLNPKHKLRSDSLSLLSEPKKVLSLILLSD